MPSMSFRTPQMIIRPWSLVLVSVLGSSLLVGCGGGSDTASREAKEQAEQEAAAAQAAKTKAEQEAAAAQAAKTKAEQEAAAAQVAKTKAEQKAAAAQVAKTKAEQEAAAAQVAKTKAEQKAAAAQVAKTKAEQEAAAAQVAKTKAEQKAAAAQVAKTKSEDRAAASAAAAAAAAAAQRKAEQEAAAKVAAAQRKAEQEAAAAKAAQVYEGIEDGVGANTASPPSTEEYYSGTDLVVDHDLDASGDDHRRITNTGTTASLSGWTGAKFSRSIAGGGEYEAAAYSFGLTEGRELRFEYANINTSDIGNEWSIDDERLELKSEADLTAVAAAPIYISSFKTTTGSSQETLDLRAGTAARTFSGTFDGVRGTYSCLALDSNTASSCGYTKNTHGEVTLILPEETPGDPNTITAQWTFKPTEGKLARVPIIYDYATYGWWLYQNSDGEYNVDSFTADRDAPGSDNFPSIRWDDITGTAEYVGSAAGYYAIRADAATGGEGAASGSFTARATLTANFEEKIDGSDGNSISGRIDQFDVSGDWSIELRAVNIDTDDSEFAGTGGTAIWTITGSEAFYESGEWSGQFRGQANDGTITGQEATAPDFVTGTFNASFLESGKIVGAFGANKKQ